MVAGFSYPSAGKRDARRFSVPTSAVGTHSDFCCGHEELGREGGELRGKRALAAKEKIHRFFIPTLAFRSAVS